MNISNVVKSAQNAIIMGGMAITSGPIGVALHLSNICSKTMTHINTIPIPTSAREAKTCLYDIVGNAWGRGSDVMVGIQSGIGKVLKRATESSSKNETSQTQITNEDNVRASKLEELAGKLGDDVNLTSMEKTIINNKGFSFPQELVDKTISTLEEKLARKKEHKTVDQAVDDALALLEKKPSENEKRLAKQQQSSQKTVDQAVDDALTLLERNPKETLTKAPKAGVTGPQFEAGAPTLEDSDEAKS